MQSEEPYQRNPDDVTDFDLKKEVISLNNMLHQIDHRLGEIFQMADSNNAKLEQLEEAVAYSTYLPYIPANPRYDHKTNQLILNRKLLIQFKGYEAELLALMFSKSSGKVKKQIYYCSEVAEELNKKRDKYNDKLATPKSVLQTITRIRDGLDLNYRAGKLLIVNSKDFRFNPHL